MKIPDAMTKNKLQAKQLLKSWSLRKTREEERNSIYRITNQQNKQNVSMRNRHANEKGIFVFSVKGPKALHVERAKETDTWIVSFDQSVRKSV